MCCCNYCCCMFAPAALRGEGVVQSERGAQLLSEEHNVRNNFPREVSQETQLHVSWLGLGRDGFVEGGCFARLEMLRCLLQLPSFERHAEGARSPRRQKYIYIYIYIYIGDVYWTYQPEQSQRVSLVTDTWEVSSETQISLRRSRYSSPHQALCTASRGNVLHQDARLGYLRLEHRGQNVSGSRCWSRSTPLYSPRTFTSTCRQRRNKHRLCSFSADMHTSSSR